MTTEKTAIKKLSFEEALQELESIVSRLESGKESLEKSINEYTRGAELKAHCEQKLNEAKMKVEKITLNQDGSVSTESQDS